MTILPPDYTNQKISAKAAELVLKRVRKPLRRRRVLYFAPRLKPDWITAPHHELIADKLQGVMSGEIKRLIISMPPRHGKSEMSSVLFPALWLGRNPDKQIIHISYASGLSNDFSRRVRAMLRDDPVYRELFPDVQLDPERARIDDWKLTAGGGFKSIGVQGGLTGHGAHLMIIDDPVKEGDEQSATTLQSIYDWYLSAARTRLAPGAAVCLIMTRWHPHDLVGRLLDLAAKNNEADQWQTLVLPALAEEDDQLGRAPGEALWEDRFSRQDLLALRSLSDRYFRALYQQKPELDDNPMFLESDFQRRQLDGYDGGNTCWTFDLASTEKDRADYSVFARWHYDYDERVLVLLQVKRFRAQWPEVKKALLEVVDTYPYDDFAFPKQTLELLAVQEIISERPEMRNQVHEVVMPGDKISRALTYSDLVRDGRAIVIEFEGNDHDAFIEEHCGFPDTAQHDDCVDASSVATHHYGIADEVVDLLMGYGSEDYV